MKYEAIIFDFDGVIFDSEALHLTAGNHALSDLDIFISVDEYFKKYMGISDVESFPKILKDYGHDLEKDEVKKIVMKKRARYVELVRSSGLLQSVNGLENFLKQLHLKTTQIAICSGANKKEIEHTLSQINDGRLTPYFKFITSIDDISRGKPSPEGYLLTAKRLNVDPKKCLVFEDTPHGVNAGKTAGMTVIALLTTHPKEKLTQADRIVKDFSELDVTEL
jgi:beta-phosphoglucomutase